MTSVQKDKTVITYFLTNNLYYCINFQAIIGTNGDSLYLLAVTASSIVKRVYNHDKNEQTHKPWELKIKW